ELNGAQTTGNTIKNNYIGVDVNATAAVPNGGEGVFITTAANGNTIGDANDANVISGNTRDGVKISGAGCAGNKVIGNFIGTDLTGKVAIPNTLDGVVITGAAANNSVGGVNPGEDNLISGNGANGVNITGAGTTGNTLNNNFIGTDIAGSAALPNLGDGVRIDGAPANFIGTAVAKGGNLISGNGGNGVRLANAGATGNLVRNNYIGSDVTGTAALGNTGSGIYVFNAGRNTIGGAVPADNLIAFNGANGVTIVGVTATGNRITRNAIFSSTRLGIDLGDNGATKNTPGSPHAGPNHLQSFPVVSAIVIGSATKVTLTLDSTPNSKFTVEIFNNPAVNPSGYGEGKTYLTSADITTNATGHGTATLNLAGVGAGQILTATATNTTTNDTSEFSKAAVVIVPIPPKITDVNFVSTGAAITGVAFKFSHALDVASAQLTKNFGLFTAGADRVFGTPDDAPIKLSKVVYDARTLTVTLTARSPLAKSQFIEAFVGGTTGKAAVLDSAGVPLDGEFTGTLPSGDGIAGGDFRALIATGTALAYNDAGGDHVILGLSGGGTMTLIRTLDGEGRYLKLAGTIARKSILSGSVKLGQPAPPADGMTTLQSVTGLKGAINHLPASFVLAHPAS
ncbi:MAG: hypothetical protein ABSH20_07885, partial [Tepidisphaeraceae bacterium]